MLFLFLHAATQPPLILTCLGGGTANKAAVATINSSGSASGRVGSTPYSATETGSIKVTSDPDGADVKVDGNFVGNAPSQLKLPVGKHMILVTKEGYGDWSKEIQVMAGADLNLKATLKVKQ